MLEGKAGAVMSIVFEGACSYSVGGGSRIKWPQFPKGHRADGGDGMMK